MGQCPSCGGDCGYTKRKGCQYGKQTIREEVLFAFPTYESALEVATNMLCDEDKEPVIYQVMGPFGTVAICYLVVEKLRRESSKIIG